MPRSRQDPRRSALRAGVPSGDPEAPGRVTSPEEDAERARALAFEQGFNLAGTCAAGPFEEHGRLAEWLDRGYGGTMGYLADSADERMDPRLVAPWARSALVVGLFYDTPSPRTAEALAGNDQRDPSDRRLWISRYAWGRDYHRVFRRPLRRLVRRLGEAFGADRRFRAWVDTGPLMDKVFAARAGLGWMGKNTMVIHPRAGSWFFIGVVLCEVDLAPHAGIVDHCGSCRRCLDACPTDAFPEPYVLDATRCISYRTIETRDDALPPDLREGLGDHLFGCDLCQDVCPFNATSPMSVLPDFRPREPGLAPSASRIDGMLEDPDAAAERLRGSPLGRPGVAGLRRTRGWHAEDG